MKKCPKCNQFKSRDLFDNDKRRIDGKYTYCKDCRRVLNGSKKLVHKTIGTLDGFLIVEGDRYPYILSDKGRIRVHIYVAEKKLGRKLLSTEAVHHVDGNKKNWSEDNIQVLLDKKHRSMESIESNRKLGRISVVLKCSSCGKQKRYSQYYKRKKMGRIYQCKDCFIKSGGSPKRQIDSLNTYLK